MIFNRNLLMRALGVFTLGVSIAALLVACNEADTASRNLSTAADQFEVNRRIIFYNGITGGYILSIEGYCSLGNNDKQGQLTVTCKTSPTSYKKHFLGLSDNVTYFAEQLEANDVSPFHYRVVFQPQTIIPDIDLNINGDELLKNRN